MSRARLLLESPDYSSTTIGDKEIELAYNKAGAVPFVILPTDTEGNYILPDEMSPRILMTDPNLFDLDQCRVIKLGPVNVTFGSRSNGKEYLTHFDLVSKKLNKDDLATNTLFRWYGGRLWLLDDKILVSCWKISKIKNYLNYLEKAIHIAYPDKPVYYEVITPENVKIAGNSYPTSGKFSWVTLDELLHGKNNDIDAKLLAQQHLNPDIKKAVAGTKGTGSDKYALIAGNKTPAEVNAAVKTSESLNHILESPDQVWTHNNGGEKLEWNDENAYAFAVLKRANTGSGYEFPKQLSALNFKGLFQNSEIRRYQIGKFDLLVSKLAGHAHWDMINQSEIELRVERSASLQHQFNIFFRRQGGRVWLLKEWQKSGPPIDAIGISFWSSNSNDIVQTRADIINTFKKIYRTDRVLVDEKDWLVDLGKANLVNNSNVDLELIKKQHLVPELKKTISSKATGSSKYHAVSGDKTPAEVLDKVKTSESRDLLESPDEMYINGKNLTWSNENAYAFSILRKVGNSYQTIEGYENIERNELSWEPDHLIDDLYIMELAWSKHSDFTYKKFTTKSVIGEGSRILTSRLLRSCGGRYWIDDNSAYVSLWDSTNNNVIRGLPSLLEKIKEEFGVTEIYTEENDETISSNDLEKLHTSPELKKAISNKDFGSTKYQKVAGDKSAAEVNSMAKTSESEEKTLTTKLGGRAKALGDTLLKFNIARTDSLWSRDPLYLDYDETAESDKSKYRLLKLHIRRGEILDAPEVSVSKNGINFIDGRHRFALAKKLGYTWIYMAVRPSEVENAIQLSIALYESKAKTLINSLLD